MLQNFHRHMKEFLKYTTNSTLHWKSESHYTSKNSAIQLRPVDKGPFIQLNNAKTFLMSELFSLIYLKTWHEGCAFCATGCPCIHDRLEINLKP